MKDFILVVASFGMGWACEQAVWAVRPRIDRALIRVSAWLGRVWRRRPQQWFTRSDPAAVAPTLPPRPQPGPRPVVGQRSTGGSHRAKQRQARFGGKSFRSRR